MRPGEPGIAGVVVTLAGVDAQGGRVSRTVVTGPDGLYRFTGLPTGTFKVSEAQPPVYLDGKDSAGKAGGTLGNDTVSAIRLRVGVAADGYNFGELPPAGLSGSVYLDYYADGVRDENEFGIAHVAVTLTGTDDLGRPVVKTTSTADDGTFAFTHLRPGRYTIAAAEPGVFSRGRAAVGTAGGTAGVDRVGNILLRAGRYGQAYTFGQGILPACRLQGPEYQAVLRQGPYPTGVASVFIKPRKGLGHFSNRTMPLIGYWLPTLASRF